MTAGSVAYGAYLKYLKENNIELDLKKPNKDAIEYAQLVVRRTQSSGSFKDLPLILSKGIYAEGKKSTSTMKALLQFQSFNLSAKWNRVRHDLLELGIKSGSQGEAIGISMWLASAAVTEMYMRTLSTAILDSLMGLEPEKEKDEMKEVIMNLISIVPFASAFISLVEYQSVPVPSLALAKKVLDDFKYYQLSTKPDKKAKWATLGAIDALGLGLGIPGTAQAGQIIKKMDRSKNQSPIYKNIGKNRSKLIRFTEEKRDMKREYSAMKLNPTAYPTTAVFKAKARNKKIGKIEREITKYNKNPTDYQLKKILNLIDQFNSSK